MNGSKRYLFLLVGGNSKKDRLLLLFITLGAIICSFSVTFFLRLTKMSAEGFNTASSTEYVYVFSNYNGKTDMPLARFEEVSGFLYLEVEYPSDNGLYNSIIKTTRLNGDEALINGMVIMSGDYDIGAAVVLNDETFTVAGKAPDYSSCYISAYNDALKGTAYSKITLFTDCALSRNSYTKLAQDSGLRYYSAGEADVVENYLVGIIYMVAAMAFCLYNINLLFSYYLRRQRKKNIVYLVCGASVEDISRLTACVGLFPMLAGSVIGILFNLAFSKPQSEMFGGLGSITFADAVIALSIMLIGAVSGVLLVLRKLRKKTYSQQREELLL